MDQAVFGALIIASLFLFFVSRMGREQITYWTASWALLIVAGLLLAIPTHPFTHELSRMCAGLFTGLQLAGAYQYANKRVPAWVFVITAVVPTIRSTVALAGYADISHMVVLPIEIVVLAIAARLVLDREPYGRDALDWSLCFAAVALSAVLLNDAIHDARGIDGTVVWFPWLVVGAVTGMLQVAVVQERTQRRRTELSMARAARAQAVQRLESLGTLAGGVAHEFNNLLQSVQGHVELAMLDLDPDQPAYRSLARTTQDTARAAELVQQIRTYASVQPYNTQPVRLHSWLQGRLEILRAAAGIKHTLALDVPEDLPLINIDSTHMEQCMVNLIRNAAEAYQGAGGTINIGATQVDWRRPGSGQPLGELAPGPHLRITISDTGCGIDVVPAERVFEPFFSTKFIGRGMGLAVTQQIIRSHGGAIGLNTGSDGTAIDIYLPTFREAVA